MSKTRNKLVRALNNEIYNLGQFLFVIKLFLNEKKFLNLDENQLLFLIKVSSIIENCFKEVKKIEDNKITEITQLYNTTENEDIKQKIDKIMEIHKNNILKANKFVESLVSPSFFINESNNQSNDTQIEKEDHNMQIENIFPIIDKEIQRYLKSKQIHSKQDLYKDLLNYLLKNCVANFRQNKSNIDMLQFPASNSLYLAAGKCGGIFLPFNQGMDPFAGSYIDMKTNSPNILEDYKGLCFGYLYNWYKKIIDKEDNCNFLLREETNLSQTHQNSIIKNQLNTKYILNFKNVDLKEKSIMIDKLMNSILPTETYSMRLAYRKYDKSLFKPTYVYHAAGIRKILDQNSKQAKIEFFDSNHGIFLFPNEKAFSQFFSMFLINHNCESCNLEVWENPEHHLPHSTSFLDQIKFSQKNDENIMSVEYFVGLLYNLTLQFTLLENNCNNKLTGISFNFLTADTLENGLKQANHPSDNYLLQVNTKEKKCFYVIANKNAKELKIDVSNMFLLNIKKAFLPYQNHQALCDEILSIFPTINGVYSPDYASLANNNNEKFLIKQIRKNVIDFLEFYLPYFTQVNDMKVILDQLTIMSQTLFSPEIKLDSHRHHFFTLKSTSSTNLNEVAQFQEISQKLENTIKKIETKKTYDL